MKPCRWLVLLALIFPWVSHAEVAIYREPDDRFWFVASASQMNVDIGDIRYQPSALGLRVGGDVFDYLGVELRVGTGLTEGLDRDRVSEDLSISRSARMEHQVASLLVAMVPVHRDWEARGYLGLANTRINESQTECRRLLNNEIFCETERASPSQTRPAWGFGARWRPFKEVGLTMDFMDYGSHGGRDIRSFEFGGVFFF